MLCIVRKKFRTICEGNINPKKQSHILVQVKENQKNLYKECMRHAEKYKIVEEFDTQTYWRNRNESRLYKKYEFTTHRSEFVTTLVIVEKHVDRIVYVRWERTVKQTTEKSVYISSIDLPLQRLAEVIRNHWWIENKLHYVLDTSFWEDKSRIRTKPEYMSLIKCLANNIMRLNWEKNIANARFRNGANSDRLNKYKYLF